MTLLHDDLSTYRGYTLDPFQKKSIEILLQGESLLVSAPTGTGKTLIADYVTEMNFRRGKHVVYTAPIKALSNQKFKEFKALLGEEHVGILTGDVVINAQAPVLIMTTEIFRNLLHTDRNRLASVAHVIFDEVHYIDDPMRGSVWEESLIFMPPEMRFLGLSATIPNVDELANWIGSIQGRKIEVITHLERAVPLAHYLYESSLGSSTFQQLQRRYKRYASRFGTTASGNIAASFDSTYHVDLVKYISPHDLPALFFTFSRRKCEAYAKELSMTESYSTPEERQEISRIIEEICDRYGGAGAQSVKSIERLFLNGIAFHHAGLLPVVKDIVEDLFEKRLIKVLYCTETFAVGLNFPCRTVCFDAVTKWDGSRFRSLSNREYFQMAGRAGRRGIDEYGNVYTVVDFNYFNPKEFPSMAEADVESISSRFTLTYNSVLNLVKNYDRPEIESILRRNFASFQASGKRESLEKEHAQLSKERKQLLGTLPIDDAERLMELFDAERQLDRIKRRNTKKSQRGRRPAGSSLKERRKLERRIDRLKQTHIPKGTIDQFRARAAAYNRVNRRLEAVTKHISTIPSHDSFIREFEDKVTLLEAMDFLRNNELTARGLFAAQINGNELLVTELYFKGVFHDWEDEAISALAASLEYEPRKGDERIRHAAFDLALVRRTIALIEKLERLYLGASVNLFNDHLAVAAEIWCKGASFSDAVEAAGVDEGDLVFGFRRAIDVIRQVRQAGRGDEALASKLSRCIDKLDRDEVSILL